MVEKLARGTARLAFWRKPDEVTPDDTAPAAASASISPPAADAPKPSWFARLKQKLQRGKESAAPALAAVPDQAVVATPAPPPVEAPPPPPPPLVPQELEEMLELSDFVTPAAHDDMLFGDDTPEEQIQALASSEVAQANPVVADGLAAEMDSLQSEPEPASVEIAQAETAQAAAPQANLPQPKATPQAAAVTAPPLAEAAPQDVGGMVEKLARGTSRLAFWRKPVEASPDAAAPAVASASIAPTTADTPKPSWFSGLKQKLQRGKEPAALVPAAVPVQAVVATPAPPPVEAAPEEGDESPKPKLVSRLLGTLSKKWVWIPSVSVAMLAVMGTLSFMLMQSKQATHELQAELASAKKQLKQVTIKPEMVPPLLVAHRDVAPHDVNHAESSPQAAAGSSPSANVDMDCAISDKASVAKNLKNCIEAFNQATAR